ncbi:MAG: hypothetical protein Q8K67_09000 [Geothrix sp.]|nr:hypothetical protein [Geothrix sp.]
MGRGHIVQILFVEEDISIWPRAEAFFRFQLGLVGAHADLHTRRRLPDRAAGFDLVSLDGRGLVPALLDHRGLLSDLRRTAIVNLHGETPGAVYGHLRHLLDRRNEGARSDGLWVFPLSWMAPWFQESLEFPELGMVADAPPPRRTSPDRTWERRSIRPLPFLMNPLLPARG